MPRRTALVVDGALTLDESVAAVLAKFNFQPAQTLATVEEALPALHKTHHDLLVIPMEQLGAAQLAMVEQELRSEPGTSVIGTGPNADPALILRALHVGIHEFLVRPVPADDLARSLERLTRRARAELSRGLVVAVFSPKGGLGSTTVAINLAFAFARKFPTRHVALADFAVSDADVRLLLNIGSAYDLGDLVGRRDRVDAEVLASTLTEQPPGVWVLPASESPEKAEALDGATTANIVAQLRTQYSLVVLDCDSQLREHTLAALDASDVVVLVTQLTIPALRSTQQTMRLFQRLGYPEEKLAIVVNRFASEEEVSLADGREVLGRDVMATLSNDYQTCARAVTKGRPVVELAPQSQLAGEFLALAEQLAAPPEPAKAPVPNESPRRRRFRPFAR